MVWVKYIIQVQVNVVMKESVIDGFDFIYGNISFNDFSVDEKVVDFYVKEVLIQLEVKGYNLNIDGL